jgi:hypothetical protein
MQNGLKPLRYIKLTIAHERFLYLGSGKTRKTLKTENTYYKYS